MIQFERGKGVTGENCLRFQRLQAECAVVMAQAREPLRDTILQAQIFVEAGNFRDSFGSRTRAGQPRRDAIVSELGAVVNLRPVKFRRDARTVFLENHVRHDGEAVLILVQRRQVGGERLRQHGENRGGGVNGSGVARRMAVERRTFAHQGVHVRDGDENSHLPASERFGDGKLVEVAGVVVVNGSPQQVTQITDIVCRLGRFDDGG